MSRPFCFDWGDKKHDVCLKAAGAERVEQSVVPHGPVELEEWARQLRQRFEGKPIAVCLELSRGPLVSALLEHDFFVIYP